MIKVIKKLNWDCGDNSCMFAAVKGGMRTNGGCRCPSEGRSSSTKIKILVDISQAAYELAKFLDDEIGMDKMELTNLWQHLARLGIHRSDSDA